MCIQRGRKQNLRALNFSSLLSQILILSSVPLIIKAKIVILAVPAKVCRECRSSSKPNKNLKTMEKDEIYRKGAKYGLKMKKIRMSGNDQKKSRMIKRQQTTRKKFVLRVDTSAVSVRRGVNEGELGTGHVPAASGGESCMDRK